MAGAVTLITVLVTHRVVSKLRQFPNAAAVFDHPPRVLVSDGHIVESQLRRSGLTEDDLYGLLRQHGIVNLDQVHLVIFEQRGKISVIRKDQVSESEPQLVRKILQQTSRG